jgi:hypothetical protein
VGLTWLSTVAIGAAACGRVPQPLPIDLLNELPAAEERGGGPPDANGASIHLDIITIGGSTKPALVTRAPARVTWSVHLVGRHPILTTAIALLPDVDGTSTSGAIARIAIIGGRSYDELARVAPETSGSAWTPIVIDLSNYAGWRWSLFYQPYRMTWKLIFSADATPRGRVAWAEPIIDMKP